MNQTNSYDQYPLWIILLTNLVSLLIYIAGGYIIYQFGITWLIVFILYLLFLEVRLYHTSCSNCYYFGKHCAFGRGKISCLFFKKGNAEKFAEKHVTWKDLLPELLVVIIPIILGGGLIIRDFSLSVLLAMILLLFLSSVGNGLVRGKLACKYCKQREQDCPAYDMFNKKK